ncbi:MULTISPECIES: hypothetical protein [Mammaliicoccus]|jgi:hypothetical protein|uniref:Uncharacterized protein n=1 Tax=Mammaliicoccus sciuri TaxID=1296 RepID=A0AAW5LEY7_MAMSC|nr:MULTISPECIES: hypothetical protein [Mammaliicoccus]KTT79342.1 membrane protein [Mammaliicoccus sciuri]MBA1395555.1 hypothetical protein [Mammaliicoccus sciuri]MBF0718192.1 hypothetical protein [Mammaliicoccus sciuri]MBF0772892.1 hypothetical protein [Mammaliicoccus sciuri]MBG9205911.1 hypothetical protein [Mammaliicoccus sciuri]
MINIIQAIGSIGTFIMAILYFISVMIQIRQIKISFIPYLSFDQIILEKKQNGIKVMNLTSSDHEYLNTAFKLLNLGGGSAKNIEVVLKLNGDEVLQRKRINILPNNQFYLIPINQKVFNEFQNTIENRYFETNMTIELKYDGQVSKKRSSNEYRISIDDFVNMDEKDLYEITFEKLEE